MSDPLKRAVALRFDLALWPPLFVRGCALIAARHRLNIDSIVLALITVTSIFVGKSEISIDGSDRTEVGSLWTLNIQVQDRWINPSMQLSVLFFISHECS